MDAHIQKEPTVPEVVTPFVPRKNPIEWMDDEDSSHCVICNKLFGRIKNRRHHCRNCGRLICGKCSSRRHIIGSEDEPARVCDDCFDSFTKKKMASYLICMYIVLAYDRVVIG